jgi:hypothetical protein
MNIEVYYYAVKSERGFRLMYAEAFDEEKTGN